jgi:two-component system, OmpR family, sensor histidine kinase BaeS
MSVSRKLFMAMGSLVVAMGVISAGVTLTVVWGMLYAMLDIDREKEITALSQAFEDYYVTHGRTWEGVQALPMDLVNGADGAGKSEVNYILLSPDQTPVVQFGEMDEEYVRRLGIRSKIYADQQLVAYLYYSDYEVANQSKLKYGLISTVTVVLLVSTAVFVLIALLVSYLISRRLTAPLKELIPVIDRLGKGELGVQAPVRSKDEYGRVAQAFNGMSSQIQLAEEARRNLVADVAHELRTPLTILRGQLDLVQQNGRSIEPESLLPLQDELIRLTRLIDDLHLLSLAEAKKLPFERKPGNIVALMQRVIDRVQFDAESKSQTVQFLNPQDSIIVCVDSNRMTQVFLNLLVNAVRYTPEGGSIVVSMDEESASSNGIKDTLLITVTDTGPGIAPEHLPFLFNRFYRTDEARTRNSGGMGLGLAIAKEFVAAQDGTIGVTSRPGQGTSFTVRVPLAARTGID